MKNNKQQEKPEKIEASLNKCNKAFAGTCPVTDSWCLNPICAFGCVDEKEQKLKD